ncbi:MAG: hypothetical protein H7293_03295 [Candidatus Saccharibacteria bacterium]|nr:hypothetical protein [Rhodoferax sp.]
MTNEEILIERGAVCVAGQLIFRNKSMGSYLNGTFIVAADGLDELEVEEVEVREVKIKPKAKKAGSGVPATDTAADELADLLDK